MVEEINLKTKGLQIKFDIEEAKRETELTLLKNRELESANMEINRQKVELEVKNKNITDSIVYAERIQRAMLPETQILIKKFPGSFVMYNPRDIVSGDFFWFYEKDDTFIVAVIDCTGHGVPGALMSMIGNDLLNHIVESRKITDPSEILFHLNNGVRTVLKQRESESESRDGMDISVCLINESKKELHFAGAINPMWIIKNNTLDVIPATKASVGGHTSDNQLFQKYVVSYEPGCRIYLFTDGYADQFGGPRGKKFKYKQLKELLLNSMSPEQNQASILSETFMKWKGPLEQVDDVCILGISL
jgi:serine phosphatase RsbU (regulator of sigma subunit)